MRHKSILIVLFVTILCCLGGLALSRKGVTESDKTLVEAPTKETRPFEILTPASSPPTSDVSAPAATAIAPLTGEERRVVLSSVVSLVTPGQGNFRPVETAGLVNLLARYGDRAIVTVADELCR